MSQKPLYSSQSNLLRQYCLRRWGKKCPVLWSIGHTVQSENRTPWSPTYTYSIHCIQTQPDLGLSGRIVPKHGISNKSCPIFIAYSRSKIGHDVFDIQYTPDTKHMDMYSNQLFFDNKRLSIKVFSNKDSLCGFPPYFFTWTIIHLHLLVSQHNVFYCHKFDVQVQSMIMLLVLHGDSKRDAQA